MSFNPTEFFTGKKSKSLNDNSYDWMKAATGGGSGSGGIPNIGIDLNFGSSDGGSTKSKKITKPKQTDLENTIHNVEHGAKNLKSGITMVRNYKGNKILAEAEKLKAKEERGKKIEAAKQVIEDYKTREAEYKALKKKEQNQKPSLFAKLRNITKRNNSIPDHLKPK
ncbi:MAG: hypothetical protein KGJ07_00505 [Patescibacteria group bacterium]|nr:hypothetical protein [Patescibacteria group bacterium]